MAGGLLNIPFTTPVLTAIGEVAAGATLTVYNTGTFTIANLYSDSGLTTPIVNPLTANSAGRFTNQTTVIWASDTLAYDAVLDFPDGSNLTFDNLPVVDISTGGGGFAPINSPNFTGVPTAPTPATNDNSNKIATTAYVQAQGYAPLVSPAFSGAPTAPTRALTDNSTNLATTAFVQSLIAGTGGSISPTGGNLIFTNGAILKTGQVLGSISSPSSRSVTFPTAFPNACIYADAVIYNAGSVASTVTGVSLISLSSAGASFLFNGYQSGSYNSVTGYFWWALGY